MAESSSVALSEAEASPARAAAGAGGMAPAVGRWLLLVWVAMLIMVALGGITRLTGSGLSIVEWRPLMGAIPPLDEADWRELFALYQQSPQYRHANHWMSLGDFKRIFFWEYLHRLWGRLIGAVVLVPWLYFIARRVLHGSLRGSRSGCSCSVVFRAGSAGTWCRAG